MFSNLDVADTGHHFYSGGCFKWRYEKQGLSSLPAPVWFDKKALATMHRRPCSSVQLMTVWAFLLYKNNSGAMSKIPQSNTGCTGRECAMERATLSNSEEGTAGHGDLFPRPQPHKGPCRCLHHSFALLKTRHWAPFGLSRVLLYFNDTSIWQGSMSAEMSSSAPMTQVTAIWRGQSAVFGQNQILRFR